MSLNSYLVTDEIRPLPGSGWTSKNAANSQESKAKYQEKLNIPQGQKGYINPDEFHLKHDFDREDLKNLEPKRSCVVSKPECVQYNYVVPEQYLKDGAKNAKIENQILENENVQSQSSNSELQSQFNMLESKFSLLQIQFNGLRIAADTINTKNNKLQEENRKLQEENRKLQEENRKLQEEISEFQQGGSRTKTRKRTKIPRRRTIQRLRSKKFPRKCFSLRKREK